MSKQPIDTKVGQVWASGGAYEPYVGRWSRLVAYEFVRWLALPIDRRWLDVGCGTGALSQALSDAAQPSAVTALDRSQEFVDYAAAHVTADHMRFEVGDAQQVRFSDDSFDAAVSGLVLNFVPQPERMLSEMRRMVRTEGIVALYVWDYAGEMQLMRYFWDAAAVLNPASRPLDEGVRFPICKPESLSALFHQAGLRDVMTRAIDVPTVFRDFEDYWSPFLGGQAPAPSYALSLSEAQRAALREQIRVSLPIETDGSIRLTARAWAVRGVK